MFAIRVKKSALPINFFDFENGMASWIWRRAPLQIFLCDNSRSLPSFLSSGIGDAAHTFSHLCIHPGRRARARARQVYMQRSTNRTVSYAREVGERSRCRGLRVRFCACLWQQSDTYNGVSEREEGRRNVSLGVAVTFSAVFAPLPLCL